MTLATGTRLGSFEILSPLGAGGMGEVYRARDSRLGREVALKVLPESLAADRERLVRFEQEARSASALNHPNIVTIHEIGRDSDTTFVAMELVDGRTLRELVASGPMPVRKALNVAAQVAEGLAKAHGAGIVHRDLKPENVMVSKDGFVKILDFGLAKLMEPGAADLSGLATMVTPETRPGTVMGTVGYMSPEQASGELVDYRSDQFSLGSVVYELLTGNKPFQKKTAAETMSAIIRDEPEPAGKLRPEIPLPVRWVLERCMAKDPDDRYAATRDLARDLAGLRDHLSEASSGGETLLAAPARRRSRARWLLAAAAVAAATAVAGWWLGRTRASRTATPTFRRLSFLSGSIGNARFAPDGQTIVYGHSTTGTGETQLYLTRLEGSESKPFDFPGDILSISKSGELAVWQARFGNAGLLAVVPMAGGAPRPLVEDVWWASADWDPSGRDLAVVRGKDRPQLEFPLGKVLAREAIGARFSPDGGEIAFWRDRETSARLEVVDRLGKEVRTISSGWNKVTGGVPCWTADGREIWFTASRPGQSDSLWAVRRSGQVRPLLKVPGALELYDVSRDGRVLLAHHTLVRLLRGQVAARAAETELAWLDSSYPSDLSADGSTVLITEDGEGAGAAPAIYLRRTDGGPATRIGDGEALALSSDKQWILARRREKDQNRLFLVPTGAGQARPLGFDGIDAGGPGFFTPDGREIVFSGTVPGHPIRLYAASVSGGAPRTIGPEGLGLQPWTSPVSPDGRRAVGVQAGKLFLFSLDGSGQSRELPGLSSPPHRAAQWSADSRSLYVYEMGTRPLRVELYDVETGAKKPWKEIPMDTTLARIVLRVTPDGRTYVYGGFSAFSELYLVEGVR